MNYCGIATALGIVAGFAFGIMVGAGIMMTKRRRFFIGGEP